MQLYGCGGFQGQEHAQSTMRRRTAHQLFSHNFPHYKLLFYSLRLPLFSLLDLLVWYPGKGRFPPEIACYVLVHNNFTTFSIARVT